jgi:malonyl-CoA/methylmalonyl-CoA synthetase
MTSSSQPSSHLFSGLIAAARENPGKPFLETPEGRILTYGELMAGTGRLAHVLKSRRVEPGDRVVVQVQKSMEAIMLYLAIVRAGAILVPLNDAYTTAELGYFIGDAEPKLVVCDPEKQAGIAAIPSSSGAACETLDRNGQGSLTRDMMLMSGSFDDAYRGPDDLAAILYTSGTTGRSKGAMLSHDNLLSNALTLADIWRFSSKDVLLHALPIFHTHGLFVATNVAIAAGASMIFLPKFDVEEIIRLLSRATVLMGVPTFYTRLLAQPQLTAQLTSQIRVFISGSAPLLAETHRAWQARTGHAILERYGMTETNMNTSNPYDGARVPGTVGFPLPGVALRIVDPKTGHGVPVGETGMIQVKGPNVFKGYWRNPEKTRAEFSADGFFITGDLGTIDEEGYVRIVGRGKDLIISGGFNVYPKEVETEIDALPGVIESAVVGLPHPDLGEAVTAMVVMEAGLEIDQAGVQSSLKQRLAGFKVPKRVVGIKELPRNTMGKVQKNVLRENYATLYRNS